MLLAVTTFAQKSNSLKVKEKPATSLSEVVTSPATIKGVRGTVKSHVNKMCPLHIEVVVNGVTVKYFVSDLPAEFQTEGTKIIFDYVQTDVVTSATCGFDKSISVSNVKLQKAKQGSFNH